MNNDDLINRINAKLKNNVITPPCFICGKPSQGTVVDLQNNRVERVCASCSTVAVSGRYEHGQDCCIQVGNVAMYFGHPDQKAT